MKKLLTLFSISSLLLLFSCTLPSGVEVTESFPVNGSYYKLYVSDGMIVTISENVDEIVITADENVMEKIKIENTSSGLRIYRRDVSIAYPNKTKVLIPYNPNLKDVEVGMDCEFHTDFGIGDPERNSKITVAYRGKFYGYVIAQNLDLIVKDDAEAMCYYDVQSELNLKIHDSSIAELDGFSDIIQLDMNNDSEMVSRWNGNYYAAQCLYCRGTINNNCKAFIDCEDAIAVTATNGSTFYYTSLPDISESLIDDSSDFVYSGGDKK